MALLSEPTVYSLYCDCNESKLIKIQLWDNLTSAYALMAPVWIHRCWIVGGVNLLQNVPAKFKKPKLHATSLMSHLFTDKEMREGSVQPGKQSK